MIVLSEPLSEGLILETHKILTDSIDGPEGDNSETYSSIYRKGSVVDSCSYRGANGMTYEQK